jgi:hypothetical protein
MRVRLLQVHGDIWDFYRQMMQLIGSNFIHEPRKGCVDKKSYFIPLQQNL